jgi:hopene-associated glycosyltransferase HpnB
LRITTLVLLITPLIAVGIAVCAIWLYLLAARGGFWRAQSQVLRESAATNASARVAVVIPARDEADVIGKAVTSLLQQNFGGELHVFVVDDHSSDGTADVVLRAAAECGKAASVMVLRGVELPAGWTGKLWAVAQGIEAAKAFAPDFLLLTDADIEHGPNTLATLVAKAEREQLALTSLMVRLRCESPAERLLIPAFVYFFFMLYPPGWIANPRRRTAGAAGGCMLVRPEALDKAGAIAAIRGEIIDDCALARAIKRSGGRVYLGLAERSASLRRYETFGEIGRMIARTAFNQLRHSTLVLAGVAVAMFVVFLLPIALLLSRSPEAVLLGGVACLLMVGSYVRMVRFYGLSAWWVCTLPYAAVFYLGATVRSALDYWRGRGGQWKGRAQDR